MDALSTMDMYSRVSAYDKFYFVVGVLLYSEMSVIDKYYHAVGCPSMNSFLCIRVSAYD